MDSRLIQDEGQEDGGAMDVDDDAQPVDVTTMEGDHSPPPPLLGIEKDNQETFILDDEGQQRDHETAVESFE